MAQFKEIGRVRTSKSTELVISQVIEDGELKGFNLNNHVTTEKYTGFTKGVFIPKASLEEFGELFKTVLDY